MHFFAIHSSSRHEKGCWMLERHFCLFQCSRNIQWHTLHVLPNYIPHAHRNLRLHFATRSQKLQVMLCKLGLLTVFSLCRNFLLWYFLQSLFVLEFFWSNDKAKRPQSYYWLIESSLRTQSSKSLEWLKIHYCIGEMQIFYIGFDQCNFAHSSHSFQDMN